MALGTSFLYLYNGAAFLVSRIFVFNLYIESYSYYLILNTIILNIDIVLYYTSKVKTLIIILRSPLIDVR